MVQIKKKTANIWEYKVGNNANFVRLWKPGVTSLYYLKHDKVFFINFEKHEWNEWTSIISKINKEPL